MEIKEKSKVSRFKKYWVKQGKKDLFTWLHRYLRLHSELLFDSGYQNMYNYYRKTLITYVKKDIDNINVDDSKLGELVDFFADVFNKNSPELVNKYKQLVEELYKISKDNPNIINEINF